ncbi:HMA2 domain-containing protein [Microseira sp. BLCC-F43]|jgi:hypothetical protein|uniref:HMA2 domain-containing protein n=1 Tax=Microseira sp. BLCC-F43 TaxID=3153602 RepID=UPI0035B9BD86
MNPQTAPNPTSDIQVVQASSGCVQLHSNNPRDLSLAILAQQLGQEVGVEAVNLDVKMGSLSINFDANILPLAQMLAILQQLGVSDTSVKITTDKQIGEILKESFLLQALISIGVAMLVTRSLNLQGARAVLANLIVGSFVHKVFEELETKSEAAIPQEEVVNETQPEISDNYQIIHAVPGRVRFRVPWLAQDSEYAKRVYNLISKHSQVNDIRINPKAASMAIAYTPSNMSDGQMRQHLVNLILNELPTETSRVDETVETVVKAPVAANLPEVSPESESLPNNDNHLHRFKPAFALALFKSITN